MVNAGAFQTAECFTFDQQKIKREKKQLCACVCVTYSSSCSSVMVWYINERPNCIP